MPKNEDPWHICLKYYKGNLFGILTSANLNWSKNSNWIICSKNNGKSFKIIKKFKRIFEFESLKQYRGSILKITNNYLEVFYSACNNKKIFLIARTKIYYK